MHWLMGIYLFEQHFCTYIGWNWCRIVLLHKCA